MQQIELDCKLTSEKDESEIYVEVFKKVVDLNTEKLEYKRSIKDKLNEIFRKKGKDTKYNKEAIPIQRLEQQRIFRDYGMMNT